MTGLKAVTFITRDIDTAIRFWLIPGYSIVYGGFGSPFTSLDAGGGTFINLSTEATEPLAGLWGRVILHVADPDALHAQFTSTGHRPHAIPRDAEWGERYFHITDPDGNEISFARPVET